MAASDAFYTEMADVAKELLAEFGTDVLIVRTAGVKINPVTRERSDEALYTFETTGLITTFKDMMLGANMVNNGTRILDSDRLLILTTDVTPRPKDRFMVGPEAIRAYYANPGYWMEGYTVEPDMPTPWNAVEIITTKPADVAVVYKVRVRK